ncbi:hypothetical protein D3C72_1690490 [compost metagenome]
MPVALQCCTRYDAPATTNTSAHSRDLSSRPARQSRRLGVATAASLASIAFGSAAIVSLSDGRIIMNTSGSSSVAMSPATRFQPEKTVSANGTIARVCCSTMLRGFPGVAMDRAIELDMPVKAQRTHAV